MTTETKKGVEAWTPNGVISYDSMNDYFDAKQNADKQAMAHLLDACDQANIDMSMIDSPTLTTKQLTFGGSRVTAALHINNNAVKAISDHSGDKLVALWQLFTKKGSLMMGVKQDQLDDAGHNWNNETVISKDDVLNRTIAALRLNASSSVIGYIASHIAYETTKPESQTPYYEGVDSDALYRVWD